MSDSFKLQEVDDIVYKVECKMIKKGAVKVDIGANPTSGGGEGCDDEETVEQVDDSSYEVIDVVDCCRLEQTNFDKKSYMAHIKEYMKAIKKKLEDKNPERIPIFEKAAANYVKTLLGNFNDYEFYTGENMDPEGMAIIYQTTEDGKSYMIFWKDGLRAEKY